MTPFYDIKNAIIDIGIMQQVFFFFKCVQIVTYNFVRSLFVEMADWKI